MFNFISQAINFNEEFSFHCSSKVIAGITQNIAGIVKTLYKVYEECQLCWNVRQLKSPTD